jgi:hypothetical protein
LALISPPASETATTICIDRDVLANSSVQARQAAAFLYLGRTVRSRVTSEAVADIRVIEIRAVCTIVTRIGAAVVGLVLAIISRVVTDTVAYMWTVRIVRAHSTVLAGVTDALIAWQTLSWKR